MVESSIVLSVLSFLILGMIEMSQMGMTFQIITSAANVGCRVATINGNSQADVTSAVSTMLAASGIKGTSYTLQTSPSDVTTTHLGDAITITISVPFKNISWFGSPMFFGKSTLSSSATMSSERP